MSHASPQSAVRSDAAAGDDDALAALVHAYHERVYRFGLRVCRDGFDADDAVQEAFARLARRPDVRADGGALSWLMTVVRHTCLRLLRPFQRQQRALGARVNALDAVPDDALGPEAALARFQLVRTVHEAIARLDRPFREVLVMRDLEGLSGSEVSAALELTEAAMKTRLHRARAALRKELAR